MNASVSTAPSRWTSFTHVVIDWTIRASLLAAGVLAACAAVAGVGLKHLCIF